MKDATNAVQKAALLFREAQHPEPETVPRLLKSLADPEVIVRHVAAIELAALAPDQLPTETIRELLQTLNRLVTLEQFHLPAEYEQATETEEDCGCLDQDITVAFASLRCGQADFLIPRLIEIMKDDRSFYEAGHALLSLSFPVCNLNTKQEELSELQRDVLQSLTENRQIWACDMTWREKLAHHGLPGTRNEIISFLHSGEEL